MYTFANMAGPPYALRREQTIPRSVAEVFAFFSLADNLNAITPSWLHFRVVAGGGEIGQGTRIRYALRWRGLPLRWTTEIVEWDPPHRFVDLQLAGPYALWRHIHTFHPTGSGGESTLMTDLVEYRLPLGALGRAAWQIAVRRDVEAIFDYRAKVIATLFTDRLPATRK